MTVKRSDILKATQSYLGTPWRHQGRARKTGVDCVGLVYCVAEELGILPDNITVPPYRTTPDGSLLSYFDEHMDLIPRSRIGVGSVAIFSFGGSPYHAGIIVNLSSRAIIHAYALHKRVVTGYLDNETYRRKFIRAYDFKGVLDG